MVQIAATNPLFRDPTFEVLGPRVDLRGASLSVDGKKLSAVAPPDPGSSASLSVSQNVRQPGQSFSPNLGASTLGRLGVGSDTLVELQTGAEQLDSGKFAPVDREGSHAQNRALDPVSVGTEREDTGQAPVKFQLGVIPGLGSSRDILESLAGNRPSSAPSALGRAIDLFI